MSGHVFITRAKLGHLACSAWLLPTDPAGVIEAPWLAADERVAGSVAAKHHTVLIDATPGWGVDIRAIPFIEAEGLQPVIWLGDFGRDSQQDVEWYADGVAEWVRACAHIEPFPSRGHRDRPLLAVPLVGTRRGGKAGEKGQLVQALLRRLEPALAEQDADVVLVTVSEEAQAAAQAARRKAWPDWNARWEAALGAELDDPGQLVAAAERLAQHGQRRKLTVFVGAGVSAAEVVPFAVELRGGGPVISERL